MKTKMTVANVSKVLASISRIGECNNRVVCDGYGSYIDDKHSGKRTPMHNINGVYVMELKVKRNKEGHVAVISQDSESDCGLRSST